MKGGRGMPGLRKGMNAANKKNKEKPKEKENERHSQLRQGAYQIEQKVEKEEYKIDVMSNHMSTLHGCLFGIFLFACVVGIMALSTFHTPMLKYNESEVYACPYDL